MTETILEAADGTGSGKTTIAPDVLLTVARLSALGTPGVAGTSPLPGGVNRLLKRGIDDGVRIEIREQALVIDLYLLLEHDHSVREVARAVQAAVTRAMLDIVGMEVLSVNVHVEDIAFPAGAAP